MKKNIFYLTLVIFLLIVLGVGCTKTEPEKYALTESEKNELIEESKVFYTMGVKGEWDQLRNKMSKDLKEDFESVENKEKGSERDLGGETLLLLDEGQTTANIVSSRIFEDTENILSEYYVELKPESNMIINIGWIKESGKMKVNEVRMMNPDKKNGGTAGAGK